MRTSHRSALGDQDKTTRDIDFLCSMFDEIDRDLMLSVYEQRESDMRKTLAFFMVQEEEDDQNEENESTESVEEDALFASLAVEEREQMIAEMRHYERMMAREEAGEMEEFEVDLEEEEHTWTNRLSEEQQEAVFDMCDIFAIEDKEAVCAVLVALDFDRERAFEQLSLQLEQFVEKSSADGGAQRGKKKRKNKYVKRDDLLGARYGLIRSQWNIPKTTVQLARQMKIEKLKKAWAPYASDAAVDTVLREANDDEKLAARRLGELYPNIHSLSSSNSSSNDNKSKDTANRAYKKQMEELANSYSGFATNVAVQPQKKKKQQQLHQKNKLGADMNFRRHDNVYRGKTPNDLRKLIRQQRIDESFLDRRRMAHHLMKERNRFFVAATNAFVAGDSRAARELSDLGRLKGQQLKEMNQSEGHQIFVEKNSKFDHMFTVDLHGLLVDEALNTLERQLDILEELARTEQNENDIAWQLKVITGKGIHSQGNYSRIKRAASKYLDKRRIRYHSTEHDGHMIVYIRGAV